MPWSVERVLALAPDPASAGAGRGQAVPATWMEPGASEAAVWGACRGSGKQPYQVCVELAEPAFRCTCPSRKIPCKHALGLLLLWARGSVPDGAEPEWVRAWLTERAERARRRPGRQAGVPPRDPEAAARRAEQRAQRVAAGAAELREWLTDRVRSGLAGADAEELYGVAARMVDAQAPGLAGGLRRAAGVIGRGRDWPGRLLTELALLHVLAGASTRLADLPADLAATVRTRLGFPTDTADVLANGERVTDQWVVTGLVDEVTERLTTRRAWLRGRDSGRPALVLSFAPPGQPLDRSLPPGHVVRGELAFYPGAAPLRALVAGADEPVRAGRPGGDAVCAALESVAQALAVDPWQDRWPLLLAGVAPVADGGGWLLVDAEGAALLIDERADPWPLLAVSAGAPVPVAGEWTATGLRPMTCWDGDRTVRL
ncbi:SWIM zinc finger family protein [Pseudonocardia adelaidensis]|uniref:SWIM zinc finger family protein n=1 Tax=Pseudonocardia adelaidensis TaxID=648754 RepID=UPI0031F036C8